MYTLVCTQCKNSYTARKKGQSSLCPDCLQKLKKKKAEERRKLLNRPPTPDTEFLVCIYTYRGDSIKRIATDLIRSPRNVQKILDVAKASGRYEQYIKIYKARGLYKK